jgi:hypothetical protein
MFRLEWLCRMSTKKHTTGWLIVALAALALILIRIVGEHIAQRSEHWTDDQWFEHMKPLFWFAAVGWGVGIVGFVVSLLLPLRLKVRDTLLRLSVGAIIGVYATAMVWSFFIDGIRDDPAQCGINTDEC